MKTYICTGILLSLLAGNAFADCDPSQKSHVFQQELQKLAINNPEKIEKINDELDRYAEELAQIAEEKNNDPQRMDRICTKLDEMIQLLRK